MSHIRQQIRERFATDCTSLTTTGARVFQSRVYPVQVAELPGLLVYTTSETSEVYEAGTTGTRSIKRNLTVVVEAFAQHLTALDDTLDTITKEVETAIANSSGLDALCEDWFLESTEISLLGDAEKPTGKASLSFNVTYFNIENDPETAK